MKVLLFGILAEITGSQAVEVDAEDLDTFRKKIVSMYPALQGQAFQVAINRMKAEANQRLQGTDEIALLPPFAGG